MRGAVRGAVSPTGAGGAEQEGAGALVGAGEGAVHVWALMSGARLASYPAAHQGARILSLACFQAPLPAPSPQRARARARSGGLRGGRGGQVPGVGEQRVVSADADGGLVLWAARPEAGLRRLGGFSAGPAAVDAVVFEPGRGAGAGRGARAGSLLTLAGSVPCVRAWDLETGLLTGEFIVYPPDFKARPPPPPPPPPARALSPARSLSLSLCANPSLTPPPPPPPGARGDGGGGVTGRAGGGRLTFRGGCRRIWCSGAPW